MTVGFNLDTLQLEYMGSFFYFSTAIGILVGAHASAVPVNGWTAFWAFGIGACAGLLVPGADFNPAVSTAKFLLNDRRDPLKLLCRIVGQIVGCLSAGLGTWLMTADVTHTGFFYPKKRDGYDLIYAFFLCFITVGPGIWLLEAYGNSKSERRIAHFITYGWQAYFQWAFVGGCFNWADGLARGIMGMITDNAHGTKGGFDSGDFWGIFWVILVSGGIIGPAGAFAFTRYQWPMIAGFSDAEIEFQKQEALENAASENPGTGA